MANYSTPTMNVAKQKLLRCADWLEKQNTEQTFMNKNQNDIQFIVENNETRKKFLLSYFVDDETVPAGVDEEDVKPLNVPLHKLRIKDLRLECEWQSCKMVTKQYDQFQKHVFNHYNDLHIMDANDKSNYVCLWDTCGHKSSDLNEMIRHINYHAYHSKLLAIGFNGRATLDLARCQKDSSKRNQLPLLKCDHYCMWIGCTATYNSMQLYLDHVKAHIDYIEENLCSWAGCGARFQRKALLTMHVRSHTGERLIACYHCGKHFATNGKLGDHLNRQVVAVRGGVGGGGGGGAWPCAACGAACGSARLLREHARRHVSLHACEYCDVSAPTLAALASHLRYRHLRDRRFHACPHCVYRAITKWDLTKHMRTHSKKKDGDNADISDEDMSDTEFTKKKKNDKKYCCHMCPEKNAKIFTRGTRLTSHLVREHGIQWPFGHSRFRYQISEDGMYRLTTTRYESLEVSQKIMERSSEPQQPLNVIMNVEVERVTQATETSPMQFTFAVKDQTPKTEVKDEKQEVKVEANRNVEITMCDVDEFGNIISSEVIKSDVYYR